MTENPLSGTMSDKKILTYNDVILLESDLTILKNPHFLNDRIIEFYFSHLTTSHPILLVPPSITFWIINCPDTDTLPDFLHPLNLPSKTLILFPVNNNDDVTLPEGGSHWSLLAFERTNNVFVHHDSFNGLNNNHAKRLYERVVGYLGGGMNMIQYVDTVRTPQQVNGYDCGVYVLAIAKEICGWFVERNEELWFKVVEERVTRSSVAGMRGEILELIRSLRGE
ncbi:hypothetical protein LXL04_005211 [Taraxacum kok-saghyz]